MTLGNALAIAGLMAGGWISTCALGQVAAGAPGERVVLYESEASNPASGQPAARALRHHRLRRLGSGAFGQPEDYSVHARLKLGVETRMVAEVTLIAADMPAPAAQNRGWRVDDGTLVWLAHEPAATSSLAIAMKTAPLQANLSAYDELWADFHTVSGLASCGAQFQLGLATPRSADGSESMLFARGAAYGALSARQVLQPANARWRTKDLRYIASRILGAGFDDEWRYAAEGQWAVLQRRTRISLDQIHAIDLSVAQGVSIHQVNLRIGRAKGDGGARILQFGKFATAPMLPDGRSGVRLDLVDALQHYFGQRWAEDDFVLHEIVIFIPGDPRALVAGGALQSIEFMTDSTPPVQRGTAGASLILPSKVLELPGRAERLVTDLRALRNRGDLQLRDATLRITPGKGHEECALRPDGIRAVKLYPDAVPKFAARLERASQPWRKSPAASYSPRGYVDIPRVLGQMPFASLGDADGDRPAVNDGKPAGDPRQNPKRPLHRLMSSSGATAAFEGETPRTTASEGLALWEGRFQAVQVRWPVAATLTPDTALVISVREGADNISGIAVAITGRDGGTIRRTLLPNVAQRLGGKQVDVKDITVRITMKQSSEPSKLRLGEMVLFEPRQLTYEEAFRAPTLDHRVGTVRPQFVDGETTPVVVRPGRVAGLAAPLRFSTVVEPAMQIFRGLKIKYQFPPAMLDAQPCPLSLGFNFAATRLERQVCLSESAAEVFLPFASLQRADAPGADVGELKSIDWSISRVPPAAQAEGFSLDFAFDGWVMLSAADEIATTPLLFAGKTPVSPGDGIVAQISSGALGREILVPIDARAIWQAAVAGEQISQPTRIWYEVEEVFLQPRTELAARSWTELKRVPVAESAPVLGNLVMVSIALVMLIVIVLVARSASPRSRGRTRLRRMIATVGEQGRRAVRWVDRGASTIYLLGAFVAIVAGLWLAGMLGWGFQGSMILVASGVIASAAWNHLAAIYASGDWATRARTLRPILAAAAIACAIWAFGRYRLAPEARWALLPLAAAAYAYLPEAMRSMRRGPHSRRWVFLIWLLLAAALYVRGIIAVPATRGENHHFTIAAAAVILAWRTALLELEPWMRARFPLAATRLYEAPGGIYFLAALGALAAAAVALVFSWRVVSEQLGTIIYFAMVIGLAREAWAWRQEAVSRSAPASGS